MTPKIVNANHLILFVMYFFHNSVANNMLILTMLPHKVKKCIPHTIKTTFLYFERFLKKLLTYLSSSSPAGHNATTKFFHSVLSLALFSASAQESLSFLSSADTVLLQVVLGRSLFGHSEDKTQPFQASAGDFLHDAFRVWFVMKALVWNSGGPEDFYIIGIHCGKSLFISALVTRQHSEP